MDDVYDLFIRGTRLLEAGHNHQATIPLSRARDLAPDKTSIREALGRALFHSQRYEQAAEEFAAVIERAPTDDYAQFCLGRSLQMLGRHAEARGRWRSPRACSRGGVTTACIATAPGPPPLGRDRAPPPAADERLGDRSAVRRRGTGAARCERGVRQRPTAAPRL